jgi:hypothetical protein
VIDLMCSAQLCLRREHLYWTAIVLVNVECLAQETRE